MSTTTAPTTDQHLKDVVLAQFTFKGDNVRAVGVAIAKSFDHTATLGFDVRVWADEVELPPLGPDDRNIIGSAWKNLTRWGIIERLEGASDHRRSTRKGRRGGIVFRYRLVNDKLLAAFLRANHIEPATGPQQELAI